MLDVHPNRDVCPVHYLKSYIFRTDVLRNAENNKNLFIGCIQPHREATGSTIGRWIKSSLSKAGVDTSIFSAHSTRGAAASKAFGCGLPVDSILKAANRASGSTFSRFYHRETAPNVSEAILNQRVY